jgi:general stress protein CsbA
MNLAVVGALVGAVVGLRFTILALIPAGILIAIYSILIEVSCSDKWWAIVLTIIIIVISIQLGYLAGTMIHAVIASIFPPQNDGWPLVGLLGRGG